MSQTLTSSNRTVTLERYARDGFNELIIPTHSKNVTLSNKLYIDFTENPRGGWTINFDVITRAQWNELYAIYIDQFDNNEMLEFNDPDLSISNVSVFLNLPDSRSIKWNRTVTQNLTITLERENAIS